VGSGDTPDLEKPVALIARSAQGIDVQAASVDEFDVDLDAVAQQCCGEISALVSAAITTLALKSNAILEVIQLLHLIRDRAQVLADAVNSTAEDHGCNYVDEAEREFAAKLQAGAS